MLMLSTESRFVVHRQQRVAFGMAECCKAFGLGLYGIRRTMHRLIKSCRVGSQTHTYIHACKPACIDTCIHTSALRVHERSSVWWLGIEPWAAKCIQNMPLCCSIPQGWWGCKSTSLHQHLLPFGSERLQLMGDVCVCVCVLLLQKSAPDRRAGV